MGKNYVELEIDRIMIKASLMLENGKFPEKCSIITYISHKMTLEEVKDKLCWIFKINEQDKTHLWMKDQLLEGDIMYSVVDQNKQIKDGMKFYLEKMLENSRWPSEERMQHKQKTEFSDMRTVGCYNLGNTCYINSVI